MLGQELEPCQFCGGEAKIIPHRGVGDPRIWFDTDGRCYLGMFNYNSEEWARIEIKYCPMCGRRLEVL